MATLKQFTSRWGYRVGPTEDGGYIYEHHLVLDDAQLSVELAHTKMPAWFDENEPIAISCLAIRATTAESQRLYQTEQGRSIEAEKLPPAMLSMLYAQLCQLAAAGSGFDASWEKF